MSRDAPPFPPEWFARDDETPDEDFYRLPRLVTHLDDPAIAAVTQLYRTWLPPGGAILDLMSSWVSHLPEEVAYERVAGVGLNETELASNPRLTEFVVANLNRDPRLPFADGSFDGAALCASIDYLVSPVEVLREASRVLRSGSPLVITFSNRCFPMKVIAIWKVLSGPDRQKLVQMFLQAAGSWEDVRAPTPIPEGGPTDPLHAVVARSRRSGGSPRGSHG